MTRSSLVLAAALALTLPASGRGDDPPKKLNVDIDLAVANVNDRSLLQSLGREHQTKVPYALVALWGDVTTAVSYRVEVNGINDSVKPEPFTPTAQTPLFFPNVADPAFGVVSKPEGLFKVDDYKNTGWDPYIQEQYLRRAFVDIHTRGKRFGVIGGRFFVPVGFQLEELRWLTDKDLTHIQRINNQTDVGAEVYYRFGSEEGLHGRISGSVITGNGNPYHDYVYFDFTRSAAEDTNSAVGGVLNARLSPAKGLDVAASGELNYVGSRIETNTTLQRSKHYDNKIVLGARYRHPSFRYVQVFSEFARYEWGLKDTSAQTLPGPPTKTPVYKNGYYVGVDLSAPLPGSRGTAGVVVTREELDRDDSLIAFLAARDLLGVSLGRKERSTIVKVYAEVGPVTAFFFYNDLKNPFPQVSAIEAISGPQAFQTVGDSKVGFGLRFRATF